LWLEACGLPLGARFYLRLFPELVACGLRLADHDACGLLLVARLKIRVLGD